jgi:hypothetical protein
MEESPTSSASGARAHDRYVDLAKVFDAGDLAGVQRLVSPEVEYLVFGAPGLAGYYRGPGAITALTAKIRSITRDRVAERQTIFGTDRLLLTRTRLTTGVELFLSQEYDDDGRLRRVAMMLTGDPTI